MSRKKFKKTNPYDLVDKLRHDQENVRLMNELTIYKQSILKAIINPKFLELKLGSFMKIAPGRKEKRLLTDP
jgi:hypothetical protein